MTHWRSVVLCSHVLGGAQIFALERIAAIGDNAVLRCNASLQRLVRDDRRYDAVRVETVSALDELATQITWANLRRAAEALAPMMRSGSVLLGDLRASAVQLVARDAGRNMIFVHDNSNYLNLKTRWTIALAACRSATVFFACRHATARLPLRRALARKLRIEYFAPYRPLAPLSVPREATLRIATVGRIEPNKNQQLALAIACALARRFRAVELTLVGSVTDPAYAEVLAEQPREPNLSVVMRQVRRSEMPALLKAQHFVLHTSCVESVPLVLFEANAIDVPFFAVDVGGIPELLPSQYLLRASPESAADTILRQVGDDTT